MKPKIEKVAYLCLGALIALGGYFFGTLRGDVNAQSELESQDFKTVRCQKLEVVDSEGNVLIVLKENIGDEVGGLITVTSKDRKGKVQLSDDSLTVDRGLSGGIVKLSVNDDRGSVLIGSLPRTTALSLETDDDSSSIIIGGRAQGTVVLSASDSQKGGVVAVTGRSGGMTQLNSAQVIITNSSGKKVGQLYVDKLGNGVIDIRDKSGKRK